MAAFELEDLDEDQPQVAEAVDHRGMHSPHRIRHQGLGRVALGPLHRQGDGAVGQTGLEQGDEDVFLRRKVVVDGGRRDPGKAGQLPHGGPVEPLALEKELAGVQDGLGRMNDRNFRRSGVGVSF